MFRFSNHGRMATRSVETGGQKTQEFMRYGSEGFTHRIYWQEITGNFLSGSTLVSVIGSPSLQAIKKAIASHWGEECTITEVEAL